MVWDVLTVTLNADAVISRCIDNVANQQNVELVHTIFDGGSSDGTKAIVANRVNQRLKLIEGKDKGIYDAINQALKFTSNEFVAILHSDDYFEGPHVLRKIQDCFERNSDTDIVYCRVNYRNSRDHTVIRRSELPSEIKLKNFYLLGGQLAHPGIFVRRHVYQNLQYNGDFRISSDYLFQFDCYFNKKLNFCRLKEACVTQQTGGTSQRNFKAFLRGKYEIFLSLRKSSSLSVINCIFTVILNVFRKSFMYLKSRYFLSGRIL